MMQRPAKHRDARLATPAAAEAYRVRAALEAAGARYTRQRGAVYTCLAAACDHPTTDEIYRCVRRKMPRISLATVYNSLDALVRANLATRLAGSDGTARYDCRGEDHYHLRDTATGEVRDLPVPFDPRLLDKLDPRLAARLAATGFQVTGYRLEVLGRFD